MLSFLLLICFATNALYCTGSKCEVCYSAGYEYSCGETVIWGGCSYKCCDGTWLTCPGCNVGKCPSVCPSTISQNVTKLMTRHQIETSPTTIDIDTFDYTYDGRFTTTVVTVVHELKNGFYQMIRNVPSTLLNGGDQIIWPGYEVDAPTPYKIVTIRHYNVTKTRTNCCASVSVGFPPHCQVKVCCGDGCCC